MKDNTTVLIKTSLGNMRFKLYDETPEHRENFIQLIKEGLYEDSLFHRVIRAFMIQGGDIEQSKKSTQLDYTISPEIRSPQFFHKRGALSAARTGDDVNPEKRSSPSQFFIVTGKLFTDSEIVSIEKMRLERAKQSIFNEKLSANKSKIKEFYTQKDMTALAVFKTTLYSEAEKEVKEKMVAYFTEEQKSIYRKKGGAPHLDGEYTVFGEMIEGFEVLDKIESLETGLNDRPIKNILINIIIY